MNNNLKQHDLHLAKINKNDEFYTRMEEIELELKYYKKHFEGKHIFCNCDDPYESNFFKYFALNFNHLKLKKLTAISYSPSPITYTQLSLFGSEKKIEFNQSDKAYKIEISKIGNYDNPYSIFDIEELLKENSNNVVTELIGNGDFRSNESIEILKECDIVVTNPPFSLFRDFVSQLVEYKKQFLIIGNQNAITYKEIFPLIKNNEMWLGNSMNGSNRYFRVPDYYKLTEKTGKIVNGVKYAFVKGVVWFTNLDNNKRNEKIDLIRKYDEKKYKHYENYDAINVDKVSEIPSNWDGLMGVPITFFHKYNPKQFDIIALGIVGSIDFTNNRKMEILKKGVKTGKFTSNAKGTLYRKWDPLFDKKPAAFMDVENKQLYQSIYARVIIKKI